jgi:hypothetical protein
MKKLILSVFVLAAVFLSVNAADDAHSVTATGVTAKAKLFKAITLLKTRNLDFGTVAVGADASGWIRVDSISSTSFNHSDANAALVASGGSQKSAEFTVTGQSDKAFTVTLPSSIPIGAQGATANKFSSSFADRTNAVLTGGSVTFYVGATLNYTTADVTGADLNGTFDVTVTYN